MCTVSMIGDHYNDMWERRFPHEWPSIPVDTVSRQEFEELKRQVLEMRELLARAKKYDEDHSEPECEVEEKMAILRKVAEAVGIDLDDVLGSTPPVKET